VGSFFQPYQCTHRAFCALTTSETPANFLEKRGKISGRDRQQGQARAGKEKLEEEEGGGWEIREVIS